MLGKLPDLADEAAIASGEHRPSGNPAIRQSRNPAIPQSRNPAILQSCNPAILQSCNPAILQSCKNGKLRHDQVKTEGPTFQKHRAERASRASPIHLFAAFPA